MPGVRACFDRLLVGFQRVFEFVVVPVINAEGFPAVRACMFGELRVLEQVFVAVLRSGRVCIEANPKCGVERGRPNQEKSDVRKEVAVRVLNSDTSCGPEAERQCRQNKNVPVSESTDFGIGEEGKEE